MSSLKNELEEAIRDVPDFPKEGIVFKDITPIFLNPDLSERVKNALADQIRVLNADVIVGIDSRGFLMGNALAQSLGVPFAIARKKGKLPAKTVSAKYSLEYGENELELHVDAINKGDRVIVHDDLLATGGTASCVADLVNQLGGKVIAFSFIVELAFLEGRRVLSENDRNVIFSLIEF